MGAPPILIIGAGLAGLSAARRLLAASTDPRRVIVVEANRSVGGRLATRQTGAATIDHGAQFFTVRSPELRAEVDEWLAIGLATEWCRGFSVTDGYPRYRVTGGMSRLAHHLRDRLRAAGVEIVTGHRVAALVPGPAAWTAVYEGPTRDPDDAAAVIVTPPIPQSLPLVRAGAVPIGDGVRSTLEAVAYHRVLALLAVLDRPAALAPPGALQQPDDPTFTFVADNQAKGISDVPAMTFHTAHRLSAELWSCSDREVLDRLLPVARGLVAPAEITSPEIKRWRYAGPIDSLPGRCLMVTDQPGPLVLAGDGFAGAKVEGAFLSGRAAADEIARTSSIHPSHEP